MVIFAPKQSAFMAKTRYNIIEITQKKTGVTFIYEDYSYWNGTRRKGTESSANFSDGRKWYSLSL